MKSASQITQDGSRSAPRVEIVHEATGVTDEGFHLQDALQRQLDVPQREYVLG